VFAPISILQQSPLMTAPGQTLELSPIVTSPMTYAASLTNAESAIFGFLPLNFLIIG
jgi:hypothetical protein